MRWKARATRSTWSGGFRTDAVDSANRLLTSRAAASVTAVRRPRDGPENLKNNNHRCQRDTARQQHCWKGDGC